MSVSGPRSSGRLGLRILVVVILAFLIATVPLEYGVRLEIPDPVSRHIDFLSSTVRMAISAELEPPNLTPQTTTQTTDVQVTFDQNHLPQNEPSISANPLDSLNLAAGANDYRLVAFGHSAWAGAYNSFDGGISWSNQLIPGFPGDTRTTVLSGFDAAGDPALAFDRNGNVYYAGLAFKIRGNSAIEGSVFTSKSTDGGRTFSQTVLVALGSRSVFNDKPYIAVDNTGGPFHGRVYVSWTRFTSFSADIMVSYSNDGGATFSTPVRVSTSILNQASVPAVGPSGELYVVWNDLSNDQILVVKSTNGGASFSGPVRVSSYIPLPRPLPNSMFRVNNSPTTAVDDTNGNVYVSFADYGRGNADILFSRSLDGAITWSPPVRVNDDVTANDQFFPWMSVAAGRLSIDFYDRRLDPTNHLIDVFYTESTDGGTSFSANLGITDVSSDPDAVVFSGGESFIGDYIGIASSSTSVHFVWTDLRNVSPNGPLDQDIFTDKVTLAAHDLAVTSVAPSTNAVQAGATVAINISVRNNGNIAESGATVQAFANATTIGTATVVSLEPGGTAGVSINWNTAGFAAGSYIIRATAILAQGLVDVNPGDNVLADGTVFVAVFTHDLALKSLMPEKLVVYEGASTNPLTVTALIQNMGTFTETSVIVSFFANSALIGSSTIPSLASGTSTPVTIGWNTNSLIKGNYALTAEVQQVSGETNLSNNQLTDGVVAVRFPGDVDGDNDVDIVDIATIAVAFDSTPATPNWNPAADIDNNRKVDIIDVSVGAANFGRVDP